ncbi:MAG: ClbS/DfsB family four-helix bundle protein [Bacteroidota bacterium]
MPRPTNKAQLLDLSQKNFDQLNDFIDSLDIADWEQEFPEGMLNRNIRDVIAHLHHWHLMMLDWYEVGMAGGKPDMPAKGYTWKTKDDLSRVIQKQYAQVPLEEARKKFAASHYRMRKLISQHSDTELFEKERYEWTGSSSLGAYLVLATSSRYDWAYKLFKKVFRRTFG